MIKSLNKRIFGCKLGTIIIYEENQIELLLKNKLDLNDLEDLEKFKFNAWKRSYLINTEMLKKIEKQPIFSAKEWVLLYNHILRKHKSEIKNIIEEMDINFSSILDTAANHKLNYEILGIKITEEETNVLKISSEIAKITLTLAFINEIVEVIAFNEGSIKIKSNLKKNNNHEDLFQMLEDYLNENYKVIEVTIEISSEEKLSNFIPYPSVEGIDDEGIIKFK